MKNMRIGLLGEKLSHSFSAIIHNYIYEKYNLNLSYELFEFSKNNIASFKNFMLDNNVIGANITIPYKTYFLDKIDFLSERAKKISAINLIYQKNGKFYGDNTDYCGFEYTLLKNDINVSNKKCFIIGRGGASFAVKKVLEDLGAEVNLLYRENKFSKINFPKNIDGYLLVNATPVGMYPNVDNCLVDKEFLKNFSVAIDLIYNPLETKFLNLAKGCGLKTINGMDMLIEQAIKTNEILFEKNFSKELNEEIKKYLEDII